MLQCIRRRLPCPVKAAVRWVLELPRRPELRYVELHLTDHCNLNCRGCTHYCPVASPWYADLAQHRRDMGRLAQLFRNVGTIRLMGG